MSSEEDFFSAHSSTPDSDLEDKFKVFTKKVIAGEEISSSLTGPSLLTKEGPTQSSSVRPHEQPGHAPRGQGWSELRSSNIAREEVVTMQQQWNRDGGYRQNGSVSPDSQHHPSHNHRPDRSPGYSPSPQNEMSLDHYQQERCDDHDLRRFQSNSSYCQNGDRHSDGLSDRDFPRPSFNYGRSGDFEPSELNENDISEEDEYDDTEEEEGEADSTFREKLLYKDRSYSEKMAIVADNIKLLTTYAVPNNVYDDFRRLKKDFAEHTNMKAEDVADMMGYTSFEALCLYAPEVTNLHTWTRYKNNDKTVIKGYIPRDISDGVRQLIREKIIGEREKELQSNEVERHINEIMSRTVIPTEKEIDFKYRLCKALNEIGGLHKFVNMGALGNMYQKMYGEPLNSKLKREMFGLESNHNLDKVEKERLRIEMRITTNETRNGLMYKLIRPLDAIEKYHDRLRYEIVKRMEEIRQAREKENELLPRGWRKLTPTSTFDSKKKEEGVSANSSIRFG